MRSRIKLRGKRFSDLRTLPDSLLVTMSAPELSRNEKSSTSLEKDDASVVVKDLAISEQKPQLEREEYLVEDYAHDVSVKVCAVLS